jgi:hypothetical protein
MKSKFNMLWLIVIEPLPVLPDQITVSLTSTVSPPAGKLESWEPSPMNVVALTAPPTATEPLAGLKVKLYPEGLDTVFVCISLIRLTTLR